MSSGYFANNLLFYHQAWLFLNIERVVLFQSLSQPNKHCIVKFTHEILVFPISAQSDVKLNQSSAMMKTTTLAGGQLILNVTLVLTDGCSDTILTGLQLMMTAGTQRIAWICHLI